MTVITKPLTSEKKPADKTPLVVPVNAEVDKYEKIHTHDAHTSIISFTNIFDA